MNSVAEKFQKIMWSTFFVESVLSKIDSTMDAFLEYPKFSGTLWRAASAVGQLCEICKENSKSSGIIFQLSILFYSRSSSKGSSKVKPI